jgi:ABC-type transport system involved in multi-copper enzyme maturation permease subunit
VSRQVGESPVLWREVRQPIFKSKWHLPVLVVAVGALMLWIYAVAGNDRETHSVVGVIGMILSMLFAASIPVAAITGEREARTWETLLSTRLSARDIVLGKIVGAIRRQWVLPAMLFANFILAGVFAGTLHPIFLLHYALLFAVPVVLLSCTGVLFSLLVKRSVQAGVLNAGLALAIWLGLPVVMLILDSSIRRLGWSGVGEAVAVYTNPVPLSLSAASGAAIGTSWGPPQGRYYLPGFSRTDLNAGTFTLVIVMHAAVYGALAAGAFALAVRGFRRWSGRT